MARGLRFSADAAAAMRAAIAEAEGAEVFAVGSVEGGSVVAIEVHARGTEDAVLALRSRPRAGQVVVHNHPSGVLRPSEADLHLAGPFGEDGIGFVIVDNAVTASTWVVEPAARITRAIDRDELVRVFAEVLPAASPGWEARPGQVEMALAVADTLDGGGVAALEAGTGTGKSLAYLVPAALWARANEGKVVVSTHTKNLQAQLASEDLPALARALDVRFAVLEGRTNYVCKRKLLAAEGGETIERARAWAATTATGKIAELDMAVDDELRDAIESDADQTLRARCPHFNTCFYYQARRTAAAAHVVVVNHALLFRDVALKAVGARLLPDFDRVILDEAHHLEQAATGAADCRASEIGIARALAPLVARRGRPGALERVSELADAAAGAAIEAAAEVPRVRAAARDAFAVLGGGVDNPLRIVGPPPHEPVYAALVEGIRALAARLGAVLAGLEGVKIPAAKMQPVLDVGRAKRRLEEAATALSGMRDVDADWVRWLDPGARGVAAVRAPLDVAPMVRAALHDGMEAAVLASATLAVAGDMRPVLGRVGLADAATRVFPSPFDFSSAVLLALPKDLPAPDQDGWWEQVIEATRAAIEASGGGAFVLCTSHEAVRRIGDALHAALGNRHAILRQGGIARERLLERFRADRGAVLVGTDSFWEGVSVKGEGLRLVVIPRLPFRVPTEPVAEARYQRIEARGGDPFRQWALPGAVLKLRQGFGRLVRSTSDRGVVMILDRRVHEAWYGRVFLSALPPATRAVGPSRAVLERVRAFFTELPPAPR